jgi:hypothetical protein
MPDDLVVSPDAALVMAQQLLDDGRPFHAHEVLEAVWKSSDPAERDLWQGLAQVAVGLTHALRGNQAGAATLLRRGAVRVSRYDGPVPEEIDKDAVSASAMALAARIEQDSLAALKPADMNIQLVAERRHDLGPDASASCRPVGG